VPPELKFEDVQFRVYRGGLLEASGSARTANFRRDTTAVGAEQIRSEFPEVPGRSSARVVAARGAGTIRPRNLVLTGGVEGEQAGQVAVTEEAHYAGEDGLVRGEKPITVRSKDYTLKGPGFTFDPRSGVMDIQGGAHVVGGERR
jgi:hypothetical protein